MILGFLEIFPVLLEFFRHRHKVVPQMLGWKELIEIQYIFRTLNQGYSGVFAHCMFLNVFVVLLT